MKAAGKDVTVIKKRLGRPRKITQQTTATADDNDAEMDIDDDIDVVNDDSSDINKQASARDDDLADSKAILHSIDTGWYNTYSPTISGTTATVTTSSKSTADSGSASSADTKGTGHAGIAKDVMNYLTALAHEAECDIDDLESSEATASQEFIDLYNKRVLQPLQFTQQHHKPARAGIDDETDDDVLDTTTMQKIMDKAQEAKE
eukprot:18561-Heterococcus_DN1.PRE.1